MTTGKNRAVCLVCTFVMCWWWPSLHAQTVEPALLAYAGMYRPEEHPEAVDAVFVEFGKLWIESAVFPREELSPAGPDRFVCVEEFTSDRGKIFTFARDGSGHVKQMVLTNADGTHPGKPEVRYSDIPQRVGNWFAYRRSEVLIPMRDGVKLHAVVLRPVGTETGTPLPFLLERTPYGVAQNVPWWLNFRNPELAKSGYIFVYEDLRGRFDSEGVFIMGHPLVLHGSSKDVDESTDAYDTVAWLLQHVPNHNGRVGVRGASYGGFTATMAGVNAHPAVKAINPQAPATNYWVGDDYFHNGAFRQTYGFDYAQIVEAQKTNNWVDMQGDMYDHFLGLVNFAGAAKEAHIEGLPTVRHFLAEPAYTPYWQSLAVERDLASVAVPTLEVGGYWDQEDMWGPQAQYAALKTHDKDHQFYLVLGPWNHGGWDGPADKLGAIDFGRPTGTEYRKTLEAPFFEKYLKDRQGFDLQGAQSFRSGVNQWKRYETWPPKAGFSPRAVYLAANGELSFKRPPGKSAGKVGSYVSDPANPVPYSKRPVHSTYGKESTWSVWLAEDQRFLRGRKDLATFQTPVLEQDTTVTGDVLADLFAATTGTDGDWVMKLIDVYPDDALQGMGGYQLMVAEEILRGRYRHSFEKPEPVKAGEVNEYRWSLHGVDHTFLKGHRMLVQVQSSWFPLYDRNPQSYVENIMVAPADAYKQATISIYGSLTHPSHLEFMSPNDEQTDRKERR